MMYKWLDHGCILERFLYLHRGSRSFYEYSTDNMICRIRIKLIVPSWPHVGATSTREPYGTFYRWDPFLIMQPNNTSKPLFWATWIHGPCVILFTGELWTYDNNRLSYHGWLLWRYEVLYRWDGIRCVYQCHMSWKILTASFDFVLRAVW